MNDERFLALISPAIGNQRLPLPPPTLSPEARQQRRLSFRNDQNYYRTKCNITGKPLISVYSPDKPFPVLAVEAFWSDEFNALHYGREYDFSRPFFEQFAELRLRTPRIATFHTQSENSDYTVHSSRNKNCYMGSSIFQCEDVQYSDLLKNCRDCADLFSCHDMELCYECVNSTACFNSDYLEQCESLTDSYLCFDCRGSQNLVGCALVRKGKNLILNQPATRENCEATIKRLKSDPAFRESFRQQFLALKKKQPKPPYWSLNAEGSNGNLLYNCKGVHSGYNIRDIDNGRYVYEVFSHVNVMDITRIAGGELLYECCSCVELRYSAFCNLTYQCDNMLYCDNCQNSCSSCFGCFSLKNGRFCILNRQYSEKEYFELVPKIVSHMKETGEWGEFFPVQLSPFGYNETKSQDWYPLTEEEAGERGWKWSNYQSPTPKGLEAISPESLPTSIDQVKDDITNKSLFCEILGKPYRITTPELLFYRRKGIAIPKRCPQQRHRDRTVSARPTKLHQRSCAKTGEPIQSIYSPDSEELVYSEKAYLESAY